MSQSHDDGVLANVAPRAPEFRIFREELCGSMPIIRVKFSSDHGQENNKIKESDRRFLYSRISYFVMRSLTLQEWKTKTLDEKRKAYFRNLYVRESNRHNGWTPAKLTAVKNLECAGNGNQTMWGRALDQSKDWEPGKDMPTDPNYGRLPSHDEEATQAGQDRLISPTKTEKKAKAKIQIGSIPPSPTRATSPLRAPTPGLENQPQALLKIDMATYDQFCKLLDDFRPGTVVAHEDLARDPKTKIVAPQLRGAYMLYLKKRVFSLATQDLRCDEWTNRSISPARQEYFKDILRKLVIRHSNWSLDKFKAIYNAEYQGKGKSTQWGKILDESYKPGQPLPVNPNYDETRKKPKQTSMEVEMVESSQKSRKTKAKSLSENNASQSATNMSSSLRALSVSGRRSASEASSQERQPAPEPFSNWRLKSGESLLKKPHKTPKAGEESLLLWKVLQKYIVLPPYSFRSDQIESVLDREIPLAKSMQDIFQNKSRFQGSTSIDLDTMYEYAVYTNTVMHARFKLGNLLRRELGIPEQTMQDFVKGYEKPTV